MLYNSLVDETSESVQTYEALFGLLSPDDKRRIAMLPNG
jgi:hypothetical protein